MTSNPNNEIRELVDRYVMDRLDATEFDRLQQLLNDDPSSREYFVSFCAMHTDLHVSARSREITGSVLDELFANDSERFSDAPDNEMEFALLEDSNSVSGSANVLSITYRVWQLIAIAASLLAIFSVVSYWNFSEQDANIAWVVDAQNCRWVNRDAVDGAIKPGTKVEIRSGLLELGFSSKANVIIEGPAKLEILSGEQIQLHRGRVAVSMPTGLSGFEVLSPQGKVVDLGTEFGVSVSENGDTDVVVFDGEVELISPENVKLDTLKQNQHARIDNEGLMVSSDLLSSQGFVREIVPPPVVVPNTYELDFDAADSRKSDFQNGIKDKNGMTTGLPVRLKGTGKGLEVNDGNLFLDHATSSLNITATKNDINRQVNLDQGDYFGIELSELGFTGREDFEVKTRILNIPDLKDFGQFGLYIGTKSDNCIRGGLIKWSGNAVNHNLFLVANSGGEDHDVNKIGYIYAGSNIELTFRRINNRYSLKVTNLDDETSNTLEIRHPAFLDGETNLQLGLFAANPFRNQHATIAVDTFSVTVWTEQPTD